MNVKYQIFVSSTYEDLKKQRDQVVKAILEMGHIPVGMEMFSAADEDQWKTIARHIEQSDYYVVIVAHRYGSLDGTISYTEKEYDYAVKCGVPTLGFVIENSANWPKDQVDTNSDAVAALQNFKDKIRRKLVSFWYSVDDLHGKVSIALMKEINNRPRTGWVPASQVIAPTMTAELARLSGENAELRRRIEEFVSKANEEQQEGEQERTIKILKQNSVTVHFAYTGVEGWRDGQKASLYKIFHLIAPELITESTTEQIADSIGHALNISDSTLATEWPVPFNSVTLWLTDFLTLGLVESSTRKHDVRDTKNYWALTTKGEQLYLNFRREILERGRFT